MDRYSHLVYQSWSLLYAGLDIYNLYFNSLGPKIRNPYSNQLKTLIGDSRSEKHCQHLANKDLYSLSIEDIHNSMLSANTYSVIETAVKFGIPTIEAYSVSDPDFPLRLEGLSQVLELDKPNSTVNIALFLLDVQLNSGMKLTPIQTLCSKMLLAAFTCHNKNKMKQGS